jgi:hypothetical protein
VVAGGVAVARRCVCEADVVVFFVVVFDVVDRAVDVFVFDTEQLRFQQLLQGRGRTAAAPELELRRRRRFLLLRPRLLLLLLLPLVVAFAADSVAGCSRQRRR